MNISPLYKKIFIGLFALNFVLLVFNIVVTKVFKASPEEEKIELSTGDVGLRFMKALHQYNMGDEWIVKQKGNSQSYKIDVPKDLPIPLLLREIGNSFDSSEAKLVSKEMKIRGVTELKIISNSHQKLFASFNYNDKISRRSAEVGFIISASVLNDDIKKELIKIPEKFLLLIIPSKENAEFVKQLRISGKEYALLLNDDTEDLDYKLSPKYSKERLKISIRALLASFNDAVCYFYDPASSLYSSIAFEYERAELNKRNIKLIDYKSIPAIDGDDYKDKLRDLISGFNQDEKKLVFLSLENYFNALPEITLFWKKGYKFINPSIMLKEMN